MAIRFDLDRMLQALKGKRVGLVCTPASWLPGVGGIDEFLVQHADVRGFLALEHGLRGELQAGIHFESYQDARTGRPVFSFYNARHTVPEEFLGSVDVVVFHVQEISARAYTYHWALSVLLEAAARSRTAVLVLDRPTPLAHLGAWGPTFSQFFPLPLPVGLPVTLGELARWLTARRGWSLDLEVIPVRDWSRQVAWPATGLPWIPPSPNIPTLNSAYAFACAGIIEATNASEGRGTCRPFEYLGAPYFDAGRLVPALRRRGLPGLSIREVYFKPVFGKHLNEVCGGVHLIFEDPARLDPLTTLLTILQEIARLHPDQFQPLPGLKKWLDGGEWTTQRFANLDLDAFRHGASQAATAFLADIGPHLLYPPG